MQTWPQTKLLRAKSQLLLQPTVLGLCVEQTLATAHKPGHLGRSLCDWVVVTLRGCKPNMGKRRKRSEHKCPEGAIDTLVGCHRTNKGAEHPHTVATPFGAMCNPWTPTRLQPSAQNPNPQPKNRHPRATQTVAVTRLGGHGNRHPCQPGST